MKRAPPPASFWHATLGSENLIILITIPSWEIHQLSWVGRGTPFKIWKRGSKQRKESLFANKKETYEIKQSKL